MTTFFEKVNRAYATLDSAITNVQTTFAVTTASGPYNDLPTGLQTVQVGDDSQGYEIMTATRSDGTLTVTRAQEGTSALPFAAGTDVKLVITKGLLEEFETAINDLEDHVPGSTTDNAVARYDGTTGDLQDSGTTLDDSDIMTHPGDLEIGDSSKMLSWLERALTISAAGANKQAGLELVGNVTSDTVVANISAHNKASSRADERIVNISAERDGDNEAGKVVIATTDSDGNLNTAQTIDSSQDTAFTGDVTVGGHVVITNTKTVIRGVFTISQAITWDGGATQACALVGDGYVVLGVYIEITTIFDGDAVVTVGDGDDADGFLTDAGINQGALGFYGQDISARGVYIANGDRKVYTGADTIDAFITETTATQGAATVYVVIERLK